MKHKKIAIYLIFIIITTALLFACGDNTNQENFEKDTLVSSELNYAQVDLSTYKTYYFDAQNGKDNNNGLSKDAPKSSIDQIEAIALTADENNHIRILLKKGSVFDGNILLSNFKSTKNKPLIVDSYGEGEKYPKIIGYGSDANINAVITVNDDNIRIYNLEITGPTAYQGIYVLPKEKGVFTNVVIEGCYVHDVNFNWIYDTKPAETHPSDINLETVCTQYKSDGSKYGRYVYRKYAGIGFNNDFISGPSWFEKIWIVNNKVENIGKIGINVYNMWDNQPGFGYGYNKYVGDSLEYNDPEKKLGRYPHKEVVCYNNTVTCPGGDALVLSGVEDGIIEKNVSYYANYLGRPGYWNAGIWVFGSKDIIMQYNEAAYTFLGGGDGQGFDIDNSCSNIYFQYNYSHHNEGGGILLCNKITKLSQYNADGSIKEEIEAPGVWKNNIIRNNLFVYNGTDLKPTKSSFITIARQVDYVYAYNNTIILRDDIFGQSIINTEDKSAGSACHDHYYYNNVFYSQDSLEAKFTITLMYDYEFKNNLYYNLSQSSVQEINDVNAITDIDPGFIEVVSFTGWDNVNKFVPGNEKLFSSGMNFSDIKKLRYDVLGNQTSKINYLGAFCK